MADVKWIKLSTHMFDDEKIRLIEQMPEADTILIIWVKLLAQAGKTNASGYIYLSETIPYTEEMLSTIFNRSLPVVRLAISTFHQFGMIEVSEEKYISIVNWDKHQSITGLDKIREQTRERVAKHREKKKELGSNVTGNGDVTDIELELYKEELEIDKEKDIPFIEIVNYLNQQAHKNYKYSTRKTKDLIKARWNDGFTLNDFKKVIDVKCKEWLNNNDMNNYLRPETLFGTKFEGYLNQKEVAHADNGGSATEAPRKSLSDIANERSRRTVLQSREVDESELPL
ncbi:phage replisome organizer N-terminal domain-containing protein [Bacillus solitudinis]|uniref:phage replisome organizer N-terminal domain-containing protein n=1 Tax=Bacillus solitudinis TaxID=2014074 RepID=UPI0012FDF4A6|nr:phage replisome organizer N-terminal domain-containing protein [Bacillus solitudinis]